MSSIPQSGAGLPEDAPLAAVRRGALVESVHRGRIAVCDPHGDVLDAVGDPDAYVYARSSAKPFQAIPLVLSGAADAFGLTDDELAVACASHNAEEPHLAAVRSLLEKAGLAEGDLQNGAHPPLYAPEAAKLARNGEEPRAIHGNCSGKHAGMLAVCAHEGYSTGGYRDPGHPLQRRILALLCEVCRLDEDEVLLSGDNCGVPAFALPLRSLATGFARIYTGEGLSDELADAALRIRSAMLEHRSSSRTRCLHGATPRRKNGENPASAWLSRTVIYAKRHYSTGALAHPFLVAGTGRLDTELMEATDLLAKSGAEAVLAVGRPEGWGMALKVSDGGGRAVRPAAFAALAGRGVVTPSGDSAVRGLHGEVVGGIGPLLDAGWAGTGR